VVASAGKDIVRLAVAASAVEAGGLTGDSASKAGWLMSSLMTAGRYLKIQILSALIMQWNGTGTCISFVWHYI
jgi:hypothetical protein